LVGGREQLEGRRRKINLPVFEDTRSPNYDRVSKVDHNRRPELFSTNDDLRRSLRADHGSAGADDRLNAEQQDD
jgi:hypothetical protein